MVVHNQLLVSSLEMLDLFSLISLQHALELLKFVDQSTLLEDDVCSIPEFSFVLYNYSLKCFPHDTVRRLNFAKLTGSFIDVIFCLRSARLPMLH
jgi:hypothetical protein